MSSPEKQEQPVVARIAERFQVDDESTDVPRFVTASLGLVASVLVAASTFTAIETGHTAIGVSFIAAVSLFVGTVTVFEAGRRLGADD